MKLNRITELVANTTGFDGLSLQIIKHVDAVEILDSGVLRVISRSVHDDATCEDSLYLAPGEWKSFARRGTTVVIESEDQVFDFEMGLSTEECVNFIAAYFERADGYAPGNARDLAREIVYNQPVGVVYGSNHVKFRFVSSSN
ncbi:hypothetical protein [Mycobacteroides abscessus]|uniref:hypothetical protein n=1 Tax=Mycobacteroides abscessus TaxID=36809 RepID=UPI000C25F5F2|nr:hypothetical protein [Mycobacteroides abscessus]